MSRVPRALARAAVLWAAAMSGCAPDGATPSVATRDSAGVALVESSGPSWTLATAWTVEPVPLLDLGRTGAGPMHEFYRVSGAAFTEDGGIAVANRGSAQIRVYDAGGRFTAALGVEGDGPGEFRRLSGIVRYTGDSLAAFDPSSRRATVLSTSGALGRVLTFDIPGNAVTQELDLFSVSESAGFFVSVTVMPSGRPPGGLALFPQLVVELSPTGALLDTVTVMRGFEQYLGPTAIGTPPFARFSHAAVHRGELCVCDGVRPEYTVFARDGTKKRIVRMPGLSLDVPKHVRDSIQASLGTGSGNARAMVEAVPATYPSCSGILVDALGYVWLERYHTPFRTSAEPRAWLIFSPDGEWLGQLDFPANFEAFQVEESRILGVARDSLDVETVQVLGLERRR